MATPLRHGLRRAGATATATAAAPPRTPAITTTRRHLSSSSSSSKLTATEAADQLMSSYGGRPTVRRQLLDPNQLQKLCLTLNRPFLPSPSSSPSAAIDVSARPPPAGTPLPPGYHLVYFTPAGTEPELGPDGTDRAFNAPGPFSRRMWAGGKMVWPGGGGGGGSGSGKGGPPRLRVGDEAEERTTLLSAAAKRSRDGGEMVLVEVEKEFWGGEGLALVDRR